MQIPVGERWRSVVTDAPPREQGTASRQGHEAAGEVRAAEAQGVGGPDRPEDVNDQAISLVAISELLGHDELAGGSAAAQAHDDRRVTRRRQRGSRGRAGRSATWAKISSDTVRNVRSADDTGDGTGQRPPPSNHDAMSAPTSIGTDHRSAGTRLRTTVMRSRGFLGRATAGG